MPSSPNMREAKISFLSQTTVNQSPFTGVSQRGDQAFALWSLEGTFPEMDDGDISRLWRSFFLQLHGRAGTFYVVIPGTALPSTGYTDTVGIVDTAAQTGLTLLTKSWGSDTLCLAEGDYFTVNDELKVMTADATPSAGAVTLNFEPALRSSPADEAVITINNPWFVGALTSDEPAWSLRPPYFHSFGFQAIEAF
jgi:hypothetical protein